MLFARGGRGLAYLIEGISNGDPTAITIAGGLGFFLVCYFVYKAKS